jgi:Sec-independent protein translocase protein TatA
MSGADRHARMAVTIRTVDLIVVLIIVLVIVIVWRGPKTLPLLGKAFGQGVREARKEIEDIKGDSDQDESSTS